MNLIPLNDPCEQPISAQCERPRSMVEVLRGKRTCLQSQLADVDAAIVALEQNPAIVNVLELVRKVNRF